MLNPFEDSVSAPKKLFRGEDLLAVPGKLFLGRVGLRAAKLLRGGHCALVPGKLLLFSEREARREERGVEVEEMEERPEGRMGEDGREAGAEAGGVDLGVFERMDIDSRSLLNIFAVVECFFGVIAVLVLMVGECKMFVVVWCVSVIV